MTKLIILPVVLFIIANIGFLIYKNRNNKKGIFVFAAIIIAAVISLNIYESSRMPIILKASKSYISDINESRSEWDTTVKLKKVFMDLNSINVTFSACGKEKIVAVELKKNPGDTNAISQCTGLWIGRRILPEDSFVGMSYASDQFINPVYLIFHLSNGESIPFEVRDTANAGDIVKVVNLNKTFDYNGSTLTLNRFYKGLNYSSIDFKSNFSPGKEIIDIKLLVNGQEMEEGTHGWSGGGNWYTGSFGFDPVDAENICIKVTNKYLKKTDVLDLNIK